MYKNDSTATTSDSFESADFNEFRQFLENACGISLGDNKQYLVANRIRNILEEHQLANFSELVKALKQGINRRLKDSVVDAMTTNETFWFRDGYPYDYLKKTLLPQLLDASNKAYGPIRIWSAACSSGQEPYSISMIIEEYKKQAAAAGILRQIQIVATDLSPSILEQARQAEYDRSAVMRGLSNDFLMRYFDEKNNLWRIKSSVKDRVDIRALNLMDSYSSLGKFDIVFCRNVLIYFNADLKRQILQKIHGVLKPKGSLFLGSSEGLAGATDLFDMVRCEPGILYRAV